MSEVNYKEIAIEMAQQLNMALTKLRPTTDWTGTLMDMKTGESYSWEESFARSIEKIPNYEVDRRWIEAKWLPAKERRNRYRELSQETTEQRIENMQKWKEANHD